MMACLFNFKKLNMKTTKLAESTKIKGNLYGENVRHFFLDLYRYQLGAKYSDDDPAEMVPMP
jgi:hypothetical protein